MDYKNCRICPRNCGADRTKQKGYCRETEQIYIARAALHMWEEPCISGEEGSGTVFFSGCNLGCVYCQNREISGGQAGKPVTVERLAEIYLDLQRQRANNINLVTAGHYLPSVAQSLKIAKEKGLNIPVVYNTSGYEKPESLEMLRGLVDIFLPDFKYISSELAEKYSYAPDYPEMVKAALVKMVELVGEPAFDKRGMMKRGVIVRHLVLPGYVRESRKVIQYLYRTYGEKIFISIMNQYTPMPGIEMRYPELGRRITELEYDKVVNYAINIGVENGFIQEGETAKESFIPPFDETGV